MNNAFYEHFLSQIFNSSQICQPSMNPLSNFAAIDFARILKELDELRAYL